VREDNHVPFINYYLCTSTGNYRHCDKEQHAFEFQFFTWTLQISITALIVYSSLLGGAIVAILTLPKLVKKSLHARSMNKEIHKLREKSSG